MASIYDENGLLNENGKLATTNFAKETKVLLMAGKSEREIRLISSVLKSIINDLTTDLARSSNG